MNALKIAIIVLLLIVHAQCIEGKLAFSLVTALALALDNSFYLHAGTGKFRPVSACSWCCGVDVYNRLKSYCLTSLAFNFVVFFLS